MIRAAREVDFRLYLVTDRHQVREGDLVSAVEAALSAGVRAVQLREKDLPGGELYELALRLREVTSRHGARLLINDRADVARAVKADGVHVPRSGLPLRVMRELVGEEMLIGASTHSLGEAREAEADGADFLTLGPVFATPSKARYGPPIGLAPVEQASCNVSIPIFAIGGIDADRVREVLRRGAFGVAVISAVLAADDVGAAARRLLDGIEGEGPGPGRRWTSVSGASHL